VLERELQARRSTDPAHSRYWRIASSAEQNRLGQPTAYRLVPGSNTSHLYHEGSPALERAGFIRHHLWATAYDPSELYATGDFPNQSAGDGLPSYSAKDRPLVAADVVVWYTFGAAHPARPEDWPVMPVHRLGFRLEPEGFFDGNPSVDLPRPAHCLAEAPGPATGTETSSPASPTA
ncbi:MAG: primary-amine oxidase, partial [Thermoplasmata archaeon]